MRFLKGLRASWLEFGARDELRQHSWDGGNRILVPLNGQEFYPIYCPDVLSEGEAAESKDYYYLRTFEIFRHMAFAPYMRTEVENFIKFAKGKSTFVDVGAAEGFYSALFAAINKERARIVSVDGCVGCQASIRERVRSCNLVHHAVKDWQLASCYLTGDDGTTLFKTPDGIETLTFTDAMERFDVRPDFMKFDIESLEYEIILSESSTKWLASVKPTLMIELHNEALKKRGLSSTPLLDRLQSIGYRIAASDTRFYKTRDAHIILEA